MEPKPAKAKREKKEREKKRKQNLTIANSIQTNYLSWIFIFVGIYLISERGNLWVDYVSFFALMFLAYFWHAMSHIHKHFSIIHHYHHEHNNFFSHFSQMLIELSLGIVPLTAYYMNLKVVNPWIVMFFTLFYTTIHNLNYGTFHINQVHREHHEELFCNLGPDICDVAFGTKSHRDMEVENTDHYILNVVLITTLILFLQYACKNKYIFQGMIYVATFFYLFVAGFLSISTFYLTFFNE